MRTSARKFFTAVALIILAESSKSWFSTKRLAIISTADAVSIFKHVNTFFIVLVAYCYYYINVEKVHKVRFQTSKPATAIITILIILYINIDIVFHTKQMNIAN